MKPLYIINSSGEKEPFSSRKLYRALRRIAVSRKAAEEISRAVEKEVYPGMKTAEIFDLAEKMLVGEDPGLALRFNLKKAMRDLGPTGFPFEKFVKEIFQELGYEVAINQIIPGACLSGYEIDFVARKENIIYVGECKYRRFSGEVVHLQDALANAARFADILSGDYFRDDKGCDIKSILVTNAKFTTQAVAYSQCQQIDLLGWKHPKDGGLESLIESHGLYPITIIPSLTGHLKEVLAGQRIILARDVLKIDPVKFSNRFKVSQGQVGALVSEARQLLQTGK